MMLKPRALLLDEPAAGMNYGEAEGLKKQIQWLRDTFKLSIVLVEHNMQVVMGVCEQIHVLDHGETIARGTPDDIRVHPKVLAAYLGEDENSAAVLAQVTERSRPELPPVSSDKMPISQKLSEAEEKTLSYSLKRALESAVEEPDLPEFKRDPDKDKF
jgi:ABC-type methionine transport system ATPase subunit